MSASGPSVQQRGLTQWAGLGGVVYVIAFIAGTILAFGGQPDFDDPPIKFIAYYSDSGHRDKIWFGWALVVLGVFFLLWFLASLRETLRRIEGGGFLTNVATIGGAVYASCTLIAIALAAGMKTMSDDTFRHQVFPEIIHAADDASYVMHSSGGVGAGALIIATSLLGMQGGLVPSWLGWVGVVGGVLAVFSILFLPQIAIAVFFLVAGVILFQGPEPRAAGPTGADVTAPPG